MVDHGIEVSQKPKNTRIQVAGSRRPNCRKLPADNSYVTKMEVVHLFHATRNVRCTVTGQLYASLFKQSVIPALKRKVDRIKPQFLCRMVLCHLSPMWVTFLNACCFQLANMGFYASRWYQIMIDIIMNMFFKLL